jgi:hypothetical protein
MTVNEHFEELERRVLGEPRDWTCEPDWLVLNAAHSSLAIARLSDRTDPEGQRRFGSALQSLADTLMRALEVHSFDRRLVEDVVLHARRDCADCWVDGELEVSDLDSAVDLLLTGMPFWLAGWIRSLRKGRTVHTVEDFEAAKLLRYTLIALSLLGSAPSEGG